MADLPALRDIVTAIAQAMSHGELEWLEAKFLPDGIVRVEYQQAEDAATVRREIRERRQQLGLIEVTLASGRVVWCPDVCLGPRCIDETDSFETTRGFQTLTVLDDRGNPRGWVPGNAREVMRNVYGWSWVR